MTPKLTIDLGLRHEYYTPFIGLADQGALSNYDPATNTLQVAGYGDVGESVGVQKLPEELRPARRRVLSPERQDRAARRLRRQHAAVPGQQPTSTTTR